MNANLHILLVLLLLLGIVIPCSGDLTAIRQGGTVFLGEENLDITASGMVNGDRIGWWAPGSSVSSEPTDVITISSPDSFYVSPSSFSGKEGLWYSWPNKIPVFNVKSPKVSVRVYDETAGFDATGKWVPRGDAVSFRISSNVYEANSRGGTAGQADIVLISPQGAKYSSVSGPLGSFSLEKIPLTSSLTSTGPVWNTGGADGGTWKIRAEISMNRIKDNLPDVGQGISETVEILIQNTNPLIKSDVAVELGEKTTTSVPVREYTPVVTQIRTTVPNQDFPSKTPEQTKQPTPEITVQQTPIVPMVTPEEIPLQTTPMESPALPVPTQSPGGIITALGACLFFFVFTKFQ
ncbi:MAG: DUF3821 domain-containing protein [Methanomicrobiales archaeon]|nr:DUF3821 domain-containing protein [Methanomicrobiales archaeon]